MKRSEQIALGAAGVILIAALWPESDPTPGANGPLAFANPQECREAGVISAIECESLWGDAATAHLRSARKFSDSASCEALNGAGGCQQSTFNGAQVFVPAMVGYLIARNAGLNGAPTAQALYPGGPRAFTPCPPGTTDPTRLANCGTTARSSSSSSGGSYRTSSGENVPAYSRARNSGSSSASTSVARGGFGSTGHSISSGG